MLQTPNTRTPDLIPSLELVARVVESPIGKLVSGFHVHSIDDTLEDAYTEAVIGSHYGRIVRGIRSRPDRPIAKGKPTQPGHIDHIAIDFLGEAIPSPDDFDSIRLLYPDAKVIVQEHPNCCGILVSRKLWIYCEGYPPLEVALGPKGEGTIGCDPRPAWPD